MKRSELFIVTKVWCTFHGKHVIPSIKRSLEFWGLDYFDLVYIHFPVALEYVDPSVRYPPGWAYDGDSEIRYAKTPLLETYREMEKAVEQGLIKHIGISNYTGALILDCLAYAKIHPSVLQVEHHPYLTQPKLYLPESLAFYVPDIPSSSSNPWLMAESKWPKRTTSQSRRIPHSALSLSVN